MLNKKIINLFSGRTFLKDAAILCSGTAIAQAIPVVTSPFLTRIYSPEDFGLFALYGAIISVLSVLSTGQYDLAITLPKKEEDAANILMFALKICFLFSFFLFIINIFFMDAIAKFFCNTAIIPWLKLIPFSIIIYSSYNSFYYWLNRKSRYKDISFNRILNSFFVAIFNIIFGLTAKKGGMILGSFLGQAIALFLIFRRIFICDKEILKKSVYKKEKKQARNYINQPIYIMPSQCISVASQQLPILIMGTLASSTSAGFFALAYRLTSLPTSLISNAIGDVFRQKASELFHIHGEIKDLYIKTIKKSLMISVIPFVLLFFMAPYFFECAFGLNWRVSGEYARILAFPAFLQFFITPIDKIFLVYHQQRYEIFYQIYRFSVISLVFYISYIYHLNDEKIIFLIAIAFSSTYFLILILSFKVVFLNGNNNRYEK